MKIARPNLINNFKKIQANLILKNLHKSWNIKDLRLHFGFEMFFVPLGSVFEFLPLSNFPCVVTIEASHLFVLKEKLLWGVSTLFDSVAFFEEIYAFQFYSFSKTHPICLVRRGHSIRPGASLFLWNKICTQFFYQPNFSGVWEFFVICDFQNL